MLADVMREVIFEVCFGSSHLLCGVRDDVQAGEALGFVGGRERFDADSHSCWRTYQ